MKLPRWYPILDTGLLASRSCDLMIAAEGLLDGGAQIVQLRHKGHWTRSLFEDAQALADLCRERGALFVINDRADMASITRAALHVGQDDLAPSDARRVIGDSLALGYSTHNEMQLREAAQEPVDYVALGPIFGTTSKINPDPEVGVNELRRLRSLTIRPLVAIGGITRDRAADVLKAGADAVAVINDMCPSENTLNAWRQRAEEWMKATNV